ncbi:unnamed protein product [Polarella glacialis]|uniref:Uncharacterized protein n=1 Tax=Polarella glacialis TaxID=89957 RepID=A0A813ICZ8_POLGL|nr:unnamed protein product [Polarella glacialis]
MLAGVCRSPLYTRPGSRLKYPVTVDGLACMVTFSCTPLLLVFPFLQNLRLSAHTLRNFPTSPLQSLIGLKLSARHSENMSSTQTMTTTLTVELATIMTSLLAVAGNNANNNGNNNNGNNNHGR